MEDNSNLLDSKVNNSERDLFAIAFQTFMLSEKNKSIYKYDFNSSIPRRLIEIYNKRIKPSYNSMIYSFKRKYISNEKLIEKNDNIEQTKGLTLVYNYIQDYDVENKDLDIFIEALNINYLLWKPTDEKNNKDIMDLKNQKLEEARILREKAKENKDLESYKKAREIEKEIEGISFKSRIGGIIRSDEVKLNKWDINIPSAREASEFLNNYISPSKKMEYKNALDNMNVIDYITYCVKEVTDMIYYQPFLDGNKRTFRSLLNLMFKVKNIPPVYIKTGEREEYKKALYTAFKEHKYDQIIGFYLFKICDSIYELDIVPYLKSKDEMHNHRIL